MSVPVRAQQFVLATALASLVAACASSGPTPTPSSTGPSATAAPSVASTPSPSSSFAPSASPAASLLFEVTTEGGFINPTATLAALPAVVVDDDGRIYTPAPPVASGDPLIPRVEVRSTGASGAAAILAAIRAAGLDQEGLAGGGIAADTGTSVFTVVTAGDTIVNRIARGGGPGRPGAVGGPPAPGGSGDPGAPAFDLLARLADASVTWGDAAVAPVPYQPVGYRVYVAPAAGGGTGAGTAVDWPLATGLDTFGTPAVADAGTAGLRSGVVTGPDAATLGAALADAPAGTPVASGGQTFNAWIRPLFPDELGS